MLSLAICIHIAIDESHQFIASIYISFIDWRRSWKRPSVKFDHSLSIENDSIKVSTEIPDGIRFRTNPVCVFIVSEHKANSIIRRSNVTIFIVLFQNALGNQLNELKLLNLNMKILIALI